MMEEALRKRGFENTCSDEPHENYWMLETYGAGTDILAEREPTGWSVARSPRGNEPQGSWTILGRELGDPEALAVVDRLIEGLDRDQDDVQGLKMRSDDVERCADFYEALGLAVERTAGADGLGATIRAGKLEMVIMPASEDMPTTRGLEIEIAVHDPGARMRAALATISPAPTPGKELPATLMDPDGRVIRVVRARA